MYLQCIVKSNFGKKGDRCILHPKDCHQGISFSVWEKVSYREDVLNVDKDHDKRYVFSTGGDFDEDKGLLYPGMAIYHQVRIIRLTEIWVNRKNRNRIETNLKLKLNFQKSKPKLVIFYTCFKPKLPNRTERKPRKISNRPTSIIRAWILSPLWPRTTMFGNSEYADNWLMKLGVT